MLELLARGGEQEIALIAIRVRRPEECRHAVDV